MKKLAIVALALLLASSAFAVQVETTIDEEAGTISYTILEDFQVVSADSVAVLRSVAFAPAGAAAVLQFL